MKMDFTNTLKDFYTFYGIKDEGPSPDVNLKDIIPIDDTVLSDISILNNLLNNDTNKRHFTICSNLLEDLANRLSIKAHLIEELEQIKDKIDLDIEGISNGIIWFQQAQETDPRNNKNDIIQGTELANIDPVVIKGLKIQGSLILRLYIAIVYMRSGPVYEILKIGSNKGCQAMNTCYKLLNSDYIRHIRNSLSHGTFKINIAGVCFKDKEYKIVSTPGFLDKICIWLFVIYYQCLLFAKKTG